MSARGNAFGNVVKDGDKVILHSASGKDLEVPILKDIEKKGAWKNQQGRLAMVGAAKHLETMECYACHTTWGLELQYENGVFVRAVTRGDGIF